MPPRLRAPGWNIGSNMQEIGVSAA